MEKEKTCLSHHSGREGERGISPDRQREVKRGQIGVERAYVVLNFCSNKTNVTTEEAGLSRFSGTNFLFLRKKGGLLGILQGQADNIKSPHAW
jgi:hypothetical protein